MPKAETKATKKSYIRFTPASRYREGGAVGPSLPDSLYSSTSVEQNFRSSSGDREKPCLSVRELNKMPQQPVCRIKCSEMAFDPQSDKSDVSKHKSALRPLVFVQTAFGENYGAWLEKEYMLRSDSMFFKRIISEGQGDSAWATDIEKFIDSQQIDCSFFIPFHLSEAPCESISCLIRHSLTPTLLMKMTTSQCVKGLVLICPHSIVNINRRLEEVKELIRDGIFSFIIAFSGDFIDPVDLVGPINIFSQNVYIHGDSPLKAVIKAFHGSDALNSTPVILIDKGGAEVGAKARQFIRWKSIWDLPLPTCANCGRGYSTGSDSVRATHVKKGDNAFRFTCPCGFRTSGMVTRPSWVQQVKKIPKRDTENASLTSKWLPYHYVYPFPTPAPPDYDYQWRDKIDPPSRKEWAHTRL